MNRNQKKRLTHWLTNFVLIAAELSQDMRLAINSGQAEMKVPADVLEILKKRGVVFEHRGTTLFEYHSEVGQTLLKVIGEKDPRFSMGLILQHKQA